MADVTLASLNPSLEQLIRARSVKQYNRSSVTLNLLNKIPGNGKNLAWNFKVGTATGQVFDEGQVVTSFNSDSTVMASLPWAEYGDSFKITGLAEDGAQFSNTEHGAAFLANAMDARERAAEKVNSDIWVGPGTGSPQRLAGLTMASNGPLSVSGTYAGTMNRTTYPQTQGIVIANGGVPRAISVSQIEYGFELAFNASGRTPTFGVTTANIWRLLSELCPVRVVRDVYIRGQKMNASFGFEHVEVNGVPVFKDVSVPSGHLGFFHDESITMEYLPTAPARIARGKVFATIPLAGLPQEQDMTGAPAGAGSALIANILKLPSAGNFDAFMLDCTLGFRVDRPNAHVMFKDIAFRAGD
jgi:hypothetical protein